MHHILAATDLSPRADRAVARAFRLADGHGALLTVMTVIDEAMPDRLARVMRPETEAHLRSFCAGLSEGGRIPFATRVVQGDPSAAIPELATAIRADLIVMGLHRKRSFLDTIRETTLERTVRLTPAPALLVRDTADHDYATILCPVDFTPASAAAVTAARALAPEAGLTSFHAVAPPVSGQPAFDARAEAAGGHLRNAEDARARWMDTQPLPVGIEAPDLRVGALLTVFSSEFAKTAPDLVAVGAHTRMGLAGRILGSFATDLVRDPPADLLIARRTG
jgi:nucleotide-binding universal stress UspA family protein